ncbi:MAG: glutathione peroxidase [Bacteroidales bacterium]
MKQVLFIFGFTLLACAIVVHIKNTDRVKTIYDFKIENIDGEMFDFSRLKGKKVLIVNVASYCGLTPQYDKLQQLYDEYKDHNFEIIAFPANNFGEQEPGSNKDIKEFCSTNFHITFPVMAKISVTGDNIAPIYEWLTHKKENGVMDAEVTWNFQKFLISEKGELIKTVDPRTDPKDREIVQWIRNKHINK